MRWAFGIVLVVLVALAAYIYAGTREWAAAESAHRRLDCADAVDRYKRAGGLFVAAQPLYGDDPDARRDECRMIEEAERLRARNRHAAAANAFRGVIEAYPRSIVRDVLEHAEARGRLDAGAAAISSHVGGDMEGFAGTPTGGVSRLGDALAAYDVVLWRYPDFAEAETGRRQLSVLWRVAARGSKCSTAEQMMALADVESVTSAEAAELKRRAQQRVPRTRLSCAQQQFTSARFGKTITTLRGIIDDYPLSSSISRAANRLLIDAEVAQVRSGRSGALPPPTAVGSASDDLVSLTVRNAAPAALELLLSGPSSRRATVRACDGCPEYGQNERPADPCATRYPATIVRVPPGSYGAVVRTTEGSVTPFYGTWELSSGTRYSECFWISARD